MRILLESLVCHDSQDGKALDCKSWIVGSTPTHGSNLLNKYKQNGIDITNNTIISYL